MRLGRSATLASTFLVFACAGREVGSPTERAPTAQLATTLPPPASAAAALPDPPTASTSPSPATSTPATSTQASPKDDIEALLVAPARPAGMSADSPSEDDSRSHSEIHAVIQAARPKMRRCFQDGLQRDPALTVALHVRVTVAPSGKVKSVIYTDAPDVVAKADPKVRGCLLAILKSLPFRKVRSETIFAMPLRFAAPAP